jgi:hypothetical protein
MIYYFCKNKYFILAIIYTNNCVDKLIMNNSYGYDQIYVNPDEQIYASYVNSMIPQVPSNKKDTYFNPSSKYNHNAKDIYSYLEDEALNKLDKTKSSRPFNEEMQRLDNIERDSKRHDNNKKSNGLLGELSKRIEEFQKRNDMLLIFIVILVAYIFITTGIERFSFQPPIYGGHVPIPTAQQPIPAPVLPTTVNSPVLTQHTTQPVSVQSTFVEPMESNTIGGATRPMQYAEQVTQTLSDQSNESPYIIYTDGSAVSHTPPNIPAMNYLPPNITIQNVHSLVISTYPPIDF